MKEVVYLIVRADRQVRVAKRPRLAADEVALKVTLNFPTSWGRVFGDIEIDMPDPTPTASVAVQDQEGGE